MWIPFGELDLGVGPENATRYPNPGEILLYPGGVSETELLFPYGHVAFASKAGPLAGNHFATVVESVEDLRELGLRCLWKGRRTSCLRRSSQPPQSAFQRVDAERHVRVVGVLVGRMAHAARAAADEEHR